ncbi:hypothetical protein M408DRAFT_30817 [Serendipita vermifera MAFF 305830]|uniref:Uncharacterized protein n=1 Tax=Serendipita vermifera MAFF 305830 TaxID=933852 RepID=A0A0C2W042_SERVB|nr:hypothetical protein M408DRAFT_30817 [Serendipita vermifera MAFF 305830]
MSASLFYLSNQPNAPTAMSCGQLLTQEDGKSVLFYGWGKGNLGKAYYAQDLMEHQCIESQVTALDYIIDHENTQTTEYSPGVPYPIKPIFGGLRFWQNRAPNLVETMERFVIFWSAYLYQFTKLMAPESTYTHFGVYYFLPPKLPMDDDDFYKITSYEEFYNYVDTVLERQAYAEAAQAMLVQSLYHSHRPIPTWSLALTAPMYILDTKSGTQVMYGHYLKEPAQLDGSTQDLHPENDYESWVMATRKQHIKFVCNWPEMCHRFDSTWSSPEECYIIFKCTGYKFKEPLEELPEHDFNGYPIYEEVRDCWKNFLSPRKDSQEPPATQIESAHSEDPVSSFQVKPSETDHLSAYNQNEISLWSIDLYIPKPKVQLEWLGSDEPKDLKRAKRFIKDKEEMDERMAWENKDTDMKIVDPNTPGDKWTEEWMARKRYLDPREPLEGETSDEYVTRMRKLDPPSPKTPSDYYSSSGSENEEQYWSDTPHDIPLTQNYPFNPFTYKQFNNRRTGGVRYLPIPHNRPPVGKGMVYVSSDEEGHSSTNSTDSDTDSDDEMEEFFNASAIASNRTTRGSPFSSEEDELESSSEEDAQYSPVTYNFDHGYFPYAPKTQEEVLIDQNSKDNEILTSPEQKPLPNPVEEDQFQTFLDLMDIEAKEDSWEYRAIRKIWRECPLPCTLEGIREKIQEYSDPLKFTDEGLKVTDFGFQDKEIEPNYLVRKEKEWKEFLKVNGIIPTFGHQNFQLLRNTWGSGTDTFDFKELNEKIKVYNTRRYRDHSYKCYSLDQSLQNAGIEKKPNNKYFQKLQEDWYDLSTPLEEEMMAWRRYMISYQVHQFYKNGHFTSTIPPHPYWDFLDLQTAPIEIMASELLQALCSRLPEPLEQEEDHMVRHLHGQECPRCLEAGTMLNIAPKQDSAPASPSADHMDSLFFTDPQAWGELKKDVEEEGWAPVSPPPVKPEEISLWGPLPSDPQWTPTDLEATPKPPKASSDPDLFQRSPFYLHPARPSTSEPSSPPSALGLYADHKEDASSALELCEVLERVAQSNSDDQYVMVPDGATQYLDIMETEYGLTVYTDAVTGEHGAYYVPELPNTS